MSDYHIPVMFKECLEYLITDPDGTYLDCTLGGGGHSRGILQNLSAKGTLIGIDRDAEAINQNAALCAEYPNFRAKKMNFGSAIEMEEVTFGMKFDGILLDLGVSSRQIDSAERGFSYMRDGKLDMRMSDAASFSAYDVINGYDFEDLIKIFRDYGEEKLAVRIARNIIQKREVKAIETTLELATLVKSCVPYDQAIKSSSRVFQAVRIEVNKELEELETFLKFSLDLLNDKGRVGIITYHSLEDRIVKNFVNEMEKDCICPTNFPRCMCSNRRKLIKVTRKPLIAEVDEVKDNSRARSAKFRVFEKCPTIG